MSKRRQDVVAAPTQTINRLHRLLKAAGIKGWHSLRKDDLVARLAAHANAS